MATSSHTRSHTNSHSSSSVMALVDLPELLQTISTQRRTGTLTVRRDDETRRVHFANGQVRALGGAPARTFADCMVWVEILTPEQRDELLGGMRGRWKEADLVEAAKAKGWLNKDGILDALDCYIEEGFSEMVGWPNPEINFAANLHGDSWAKLQVEAGINVAVGSVLLESLRRLDETKSMAQYVPEAWDVLMRDEAAPPADASKDEQLVLGAIGDGVAVRDLAQGRLPPFRGKRAIARLRQLGVIRIATAAEVVAHADSAHAHGRKPDAYALYQRALALGADSARIHMHIAELAEALEDNDRAAGEYIAAADQMNEPAAAVVALRNSLRLGSFRRPAIERLLAIFRRLGEKEEAVPLLLELADLHERAKDIDQAAVAVREAQELGAEPIACARIRARLALAEGDMEQAVVQMEQVARGAHAAKQHAEADQAYAQLLELLPGRGEYALHRAEAQIALGAKEDAATTLRSALQHQQAEDLQVAMYELLAKAVPGDYQAHDWLAKAYQKRKNRDGATEQLKLVAAAQEKAGEHGPLAQTLEQMLTYGGEQVGTLKRLALVYSRLGQEGKASATLVRAIDASLAAGDLDAARDMADVAVDLDPANLLLRIRLAHVAHRQGNADIAEAHFRAAARIARGVGKPEVAQKMLINVRNLRPDDLLVRIELGELAMELQDESTDEILRDALQFAARTSNWGIALEHARKRVELAGKDALAPRTELVELMRRMGDTAGELKAGKELLDDLLQKGDFEHAVELLKRLVASNSRNSDLVLQLADIMSGLGDSKQSHRFYRHAVTLLQLEGRVDDAKKALDTLERIGSDAEPLAVARDHLAKGQAIEWDAIRFSLSQNQAKKIAEDIVSLSGSHKAITPSP